MLAEIAVEEYAHALDACVEQLLWETGITGPPVDAFRIAQQLGMVVANDASTGARARLVRLGQGPYPRETIYIGPEPRAERRQWAVAHEIGESVAVRVFRSLGVDRRSAPPNARESVANELAQRLLLPGAWFAADGDDCEWDLKELKQLYSTASHELVARRMLDMPLPVVITLCDQGRVVWRCANRRSAAAQLSAVEAAVWQRTYRRGQPVVERADPLVDGFTLVRGWPVHEPGWRREIVRAEIAVIDVQ